MFGFHVQRGSGIIQNQNRVFLGQRPRDADSLLLPAGKSDAPFSDDRIVFSFHPLDEAACLRVRRSLPHHPVIRCAFFAQFDIFVNRIGKQEYILCHAADIRSKLFQRKLPDIHTIDGNRAARGVIHTLQKLYDGCFARSGRPHNAERFPGFQRKGNIMQNLIHIRFVERNPVETYLSLNALQYHRFFRFPNAWLFLINLFDFLVRGNRRRKTVRQPAEHLHRPHDVIGILYECRHFSQCHLSRDNEFSSDQYGQNRQQFGNNRKIRVVFHKQP